MKIINTCPLGHTCEKIVDDHIEVCHWYTKMTGIDPQTGSEINEHKCAMAWLPIVGVEQSGASRQVAASVQSLRNETVKRQDAAMQLVKEDAKVIESK